MRLVFGNGVHPVNIPEGRVGSANELCEPWGKLVQQWVVLIFNQQGWSFTAG